MDPNLRSELGLERRDFHAVLTAIDELRETAQASSVLISNTTSAPWTVHAIRTVLKQTRPFRNHSVPTGDFANRWRPVPRVKPWTRPQLPRLADSIHAMALALSQPRKS